MHQTITNALTFDVEEWFQVSAFAGTIARERWGELPSRVEHNTERLLALLAQRQIRATFFVLGWVAERFPQLVRTIHRAGHEIACHGYSHRLIYDQAPAVFRAETAAARELLQELTGAEVAGYRAASYSITRRSLWALDILAELGFRYDSSIVPVVHDRYGIPGAKPWPHLVAGGALVEFPPTTVAFAGTRVPVGGGGYFRLFPYRLTRAALARVNREGQPFIFYLHPWEIDPNQPRVKAPLVSRLRHYLNLQRCEARLLALLGDFSFTTVREVLARQALCAPAPRGALADG